MRARVRVATLLWSQVRWLTRVSKCFPSLACLGTHIAVSGLETLPGLFGWVCCGSAGLGVAFFTAYSAYSRATMPSMDRVNAVSALATQIDSLASTIQEFGYTGRSVTKLQFKESIRAYHPITDEEVDLVFAAFDSDGMSWGCLWWWCAHSFWQWFPEGWFNPFETIEP